MDCWVGFFKEWQTLVSAVLALVAAGFTIRKIGEQIKLQQEQFDQTNESKFWSARAHLPDALSAVAGYTEAGGLALRDESAEVPEYPTREISELKSAIEHLHPGAAKRVFKLLVDLQVVNSRLRQYLQERTEGRNPDQGLAELYYDVANIRALVDSIYDYARGDHEEIDDSPLSVEDLLSGLRCSVGLVNYVRNEQEFAPTVEFINRHHEHRE